MLGRLFLTSAPNFAHESEEFLEVPQSRNLGSKFGKMEIPQMKKLVLVLTCFMSISSAFAMDCHIKAERLARYATMEEESGRGGQPYNVIQAARDLKHFDFEYQYAGTKDFVSGLDHKAIHHVLVTDKKTKELKYKWEVVTANPVECHTL